MAIDWTNEQDVRAAAARLPELFRREFSTALEVCVELLIAEVVKETPTGMGIGGHLANSIQRGQPYNYNDGIAIDYGTPAVHAETIEFGRRPGSTPPPVGPIQQWVEWRGIAGPDESLGIAYAIARKIGERGFKNRPQGWQMFKKGAKKAESKYRAVMDSARARIEQEASNGFQ